MGVQIFLAKLSGKMEIIQLKMLNKRKRVMSDDMEFSVIFKLPFIPAH